MIREVIGWRCDTCGFLVFSTASCDTSQRVAMDNAARHHVTTCTHATTPIPESSPSPSPVARAPEPADVPTAQTDRKLN